MSKTLGALSMALLVIGFVLFFLGREPPNTRADLPLAIIGFTLILLGASALGWVIA